MARWVGGEAEVESLLAAGDLQKLTGEAANGERLSAKAAITLATARSASNGILTRRSSSYDAARQALTGLLAQQGLRPTTKGGHYAVEQTARAQFGSGGFRQFGALRRRRNELEYPERPGDDATNDEAAEALENARTIVTAAQALLDQVGLF